MLSITIGYVAAPLPNYTSRQKITLLQMLPLRAYIRIAAVTC